MGLIVSALQLLAILLIALVAGSVFGIWRGYDPAAYSALTFLEVHQGAVRGLNVLLPVMAMGALVLTALLAWLAWRQSPAFPLYLAAFAAMIAGGVITRFFNQPINAEVMNWTAGAMPANWMELRDAWWHWHMIRLAVTIAALALLIAAVMADRSTATN